MSTSGSKRTIVLFEDHQERIDELQVAIKPMLGTKYRLEVFPLHVAPKTMTGPYEDRLAEDLKAPQFGNIVLVVTDRDLSTQEWGGLSEAAVSRAAEKLGLPVACYRQKKPNVEDRLTRKPGNGQLELPFLVDERAHRVITLCNGFVEMEKLLAPARAPVTKKSTAKTPIKAKLAPKADAGTPGTLLAGILQQPYVATHFDLFACGDQRAISEIMSVSQDNKTQLKPEQERRLVIALGVWLADLVMEFPGLLLNRTAAASYLDIAPDDFAKAKVQTVFESAKYVNLPFADEHNPLWWRHLLDDLVTDGEVVSGRALCESKGIKKLSYCPCSVKPELHAGYYCMATERPISEEQSSGRVSWFPVGADLARITARTHRVLAPWIGS
ncbi:hypothetical protein OOZ63_26470 [Paucibacter sp. PLA-PC-4]|uniref:hypothetical protein n=1 Tax=Paucibacter sp. PLA-PC-4 TaxID=2993655 RepID=UPI00224AAAA9|nr:hypothetical protein [Paucibacter sp. PLA-PC-4]MCX2865375.1 hypothetical protein [Paucibacter sp. PLA-PC-4]